MTESKILISNEVKILYKSKILISNEVRILYGLMIILGYLGLAIDDWGMTIGSWKLIPGPGSLTSKIDLNLLKLYQILVVKGYIGPGLCILFHIFHALYTF